MNKIKVAINGFGRIGRISLRILLSKSNIEVVAINDITDVKTLAHLFKYDSTHGIYNGTVSYDDENLIVNGTKIKSLSERDPGNLPWGDLGVDIVLESTGLFRDKETVGKHLSAGAKKVIISAPAKGDIKMIVLGINDDTITNEDTILSNASCTTNCLAPMVKVLDDNWGVDKGFMTTIHAYTQDQALQDRPHKDLRRARAAAHSIIPTTTGAAKAVGLVLPHLSGKLNGQAMRVPVLNGSVTDFDCILKKTASREEINAAFKKAGSSSLKGILEYSEEPLVSVDIIGNPHSCIFDAMSTMSYDNLVKVVGWYDNEAGYSYRVVDMIEKVGIQQSDKLTV